MKDSKGYWVWKFQRVVMMCKRGNWCGQSGKRKRNDYRKRGLSREDGLTGELAEGCEEIDSEDRFRSMPGLNSLLNGRVLLSWTSFRAFSMDARVMGIECRLAFFVPPHGQPSNFL